MEGRLYTPPKLPDVRNLVWRAVFVLGLLVFAVLVVYFEGGLVDARTGRHPGFLDCIYYILITITTVGYGDIVPVATSSRLVDAILLTPIRFIVILTFFNTAYQLTIRRLQEDFRMKRTVDNLERHCILCGFGATGRAALDELLLQGRPKEQIVVLELDEEALKEAAGTGVVVVHGDATREAVLKSVAIERAAHAIVCPGRDDTAVLIALTVHHLNPNAQVIAMCKEAENARLLQRSGASVIVSPSVAAGNMLAAATRRTHLVETMQDILSFGGALQLDERVVREGEAGRHPRDLEGCAVLRVYRSGRHFDVPRLPLLEEGDILVYVRGAEPRNTVP